MSFKMLKSEDSVDTESIHSNPQPEVYTIGTTRKTDRTMSFKRPESEESMSSNPQPDVATIGAGAGSLETSGYDYQTMMSFYPQTAPYSSILNISHDMAVDLYHRAVRVVRYVRDDSLAVNAIKYKNFVVSQLKKRPEREEFNCEDVILAVITIVGFAYNLMVDGYVIALYYREGSTVFAVSTALALFAPLILVNCTSMMWYNDEDHECSVEPVILQRSHRWSGPVAWCVCAAMHTVLLGQVYRTVIMIYVGIKSWGVDRARERRKSEVSNAIAAYHRQLDQSDDGSMSSATSDSVPQLSHCPSLDDARTLVDETHPCVDYYSMFVHQEYDIAVLDLIDGFLHDGTQVILQVYMILKPETEVEEGNEASIREIMQIQSVVVALLTLSWCFSEYSRAMRSSQPHKRKLNLMGMILMSLWRLFTLVPRVFAFAFFASCSRFYLVGFVAAHWLLMSYWVRLQRAAEGHQLKFGEVVTCLVAGYVYIFCFLRIRESKEPTRAKYFLYYFLIFVENQFLLMYWYFHTREAYGLAVLMTLTGIYFIGLMFMVVYYKWVHPEDHLPDRTRRARLI